jgi:hypothetical protein
MKITVQLVVCDDDDYKETLTDVVVLEKACQRIEQVGLTLAEAKVPHSPGFSGNVLNPSQWS